MKNAQSNNYVVFRSHHAVTGSFWYLLIILGWGGGGGVAVAVLIKSEGFRIGGGWQR